MDENIDLTKNIEIKQALKEFETKSNREPIIKGGMIIPQASLIPKNETVEGIKFETDNYKVTKDSSETSTPKMVELVMKWSGVKEERTAEYILLGFVIVAIGISLFLFFGGSSSTSIDKAARDKLFQLHPELMVK